MFDFVARVPTTNARIVVSLGLAIATGARVIGTTWVPPTEWLLFLAAMLGLDVTQFFVKRRTQWRRRR